MTRLTSTRRRLGLVAAATLAMSSITGIAPVTAAVPASGLVCTTDASPNPSFTLHATSGYVGIPDGNTIFMWSYSDSGSTAFQLPGPTLCVNQGENVSVTLVNDLGEPVSIVFPGQTGVQADGAPAEPQLSGSQVTSLVQPAAVGGQMTYTFTASEPGTYIYQSGTDPAKQVQMGLYGALVIRPTGHPDWAYDDVATKFKASTEYVMLLSEVDPDLHQAVERGSPAYDITAYHPRYWMINGRSFPDTIAPNGAAWLPAQPYSAMVHIEPNDASTNPDPALIRYLNVGALNHPMHPHGNHGRIIARDGRLLEGDGGQDLSYEKFTVLVGAGQTWDSTFMFSDQEGWDPTTNPIPVTLPQQQNIVFKDGATWYAGSPYLGVQDELPTGTTSYNECGEYYHVAHSHALQEAANYDAGFGGMLTLIRIDPPGGC